jgi:hypothetical protein
MDLIPITIIFIVFSSITLIVLIIGLISYSEKRLEHKQILAAIEKGTPLSELRPSKPESEPEPGPAWIRYISIGIALLTIALFLGIVGRFDFGIEEILVAILCGVGIAWVIRGLLHRKYHLKDQTLSQANTTED